MQCINFTDVASSVPNAYRCAYEAKHEIKISYTIRLFNTEPQNAETNCKFFELEYMWS